MANIKKMRKVKITKKPMRDPKRRKRPLKMIQWVKIFSGYNELTIQERIDHYLETHPEAVIYIMNYTTCCVPEIINDAREPEIGHDLLVHNALIVFHGPEGSRWADPGKNEGHNLNKRL